MERELREIAAQRDEDFNTYQALLNEAQSRQRELEEKVANLQSHLTQADAILNNESYLLEKSSVFRHLQQSFDRLQQEHKLLSGADVQNRELQAYVATMRQGEGPRHVEGYYVQNIHELAIRVRTFAGDLSFDIKRWGKENTTTFLNALVNVSDDGGKAVRFIEKYRKTNIQRSFESKRARTNFFTYLIALFLYEEIFTRFAFGMDQTSSRNLSDIQKSILNQGML